MTWLDFLVLTLAASAVVDVWSNGSIFADWRAFFQDKADEPLEPDMSEQPEPFEGWPEGHPNAERPDEEDEGEPLPFMMRVADRVVPRFGAELVSCMFCFSHHTPYVVALLFFLPSMFVEQPWLIFLLKVPAYSLAATRLGNIVNALVPVGAKYQHD